MPILLMPTYCFGLLSDLYGRCLAGLAALSSVRLRVEDDHLKSVIDDYTSVTRAQLQRLHDLATANGQELTTPDQSMTLGELRHVAREVARGLLSQQIDAAATTCLHRMATAKLDLYREGGHWFNAADEPDARGVMLAGEAEETALVDSLATLQRQTVFRLPAENGQKILSSAF